MNHAWKEIYDQCGTKLEKSSVIDSLFYTHEYDQPAQKYFDRFQIHKILFLSAKKTFPA